MRRWPSRIILVRVLDPEVGDVRIRFLDMPVANVVTAANLFDALKSSLLKRSLRTMLMKGVVKKERGLCARVQN